MKDVTQSYKNITKTATTLRNISSIIEVHITEDAGEYTYDVSDSFIGGLFSQIFDQRAGDVEWASLERGRFKLDGSMAVPGYSKKYKYGLISTYLSDEEGKINFDITIKFDKPHICNGITLEFAEPVKSIVIKTDNLTYTSEDMAKSYYIEDKKEFSTLIIQIKEIEPYRRVRLNNIYLGTILKIDDNRIYSMDIIDEIDLKNEMLPSGELDFEISDENKEFNLLNQNGIYKYLKEKQLIIPYVGVNINGITEYAQMGKYYLKECTSGNKQATFTAYNIIEWWDNEQFRESVIGTTTLYDMLDKFLSGYEHEIDTELSEIQVNSYIPVCTKREAFRLMLEAGNCLYRIEPTGKIVVNKHKKLINRNRYINYAGQQYLGTFYTEIESKTLNNTILADNILDEYPTILQESQYASCNINVYRYAEDTDTITLFSGKVCIENGIYKNGKYVVWVQYNTEIATQISVNISEYDAYAQGCYVYLTEDTNIVIKGKKVELSKTEVKVKKYNYDNEYSIDNFLVNSDALAKNIADYILDGYDINVEFDYRCFPYLDSGDEIVVETDFGEQTFYLKKHQISYDGSLSASVEGVGRFYE